MPLSVVLIILFPFIIQYRRGGLWKLLAPIGVLFWIIDVIANYTEWAFVFGWPAKGVHTVSRRLMIMENEDPVGVRRSFARMINTILSATEPDGKH